MDDYDREVVQVRVAAAGTSCAAGRLAFETVLGVTRQKALLGFAEGNAPFPTTLVDTVENVCVEEEWGLCRDHHIIQRFIPLVLGMERQHQLLGQPPADTSAAVKKALGYVYKCFQFQLEVASTAGTTCDEWTFTEPVQGLVKLKLEHRAHEHRRPGPGHQRDGAADVAELLDRVPGQLHEGQQHHPDRSRASSWAPSPGPRRATR